LFVTVVAAAFVTISPVNQA